LLVLWGLLVVVVLLWLLLRVATAAATPAAGWKAAAPVLPLLNAMLAVLLLVLRRIKDIIWQGCHGVLHLRCPVGPGASLRRATIGRLHVLVLVLLVVLRVVMVLLLVLVLLVLRLVLVLVLYRRLHVPIVCGG
jgi:hypothetical protein